MGERADPCPTPTSTLKKLRRDIVPTIPCFSTYLVICLYDDDDLE